MSTAGGGGKGSRKSSISWQFYHQYQQRWCKSKCSEYRCNVIIGAFLLRKFNTELFYTYNDERTYYHRPYNHISAYTKHQFYWLLS